MLGSNKMLRIFFAHYFDYWDCGGLRQACLVGGEIVNLISQKHLALFYFFL